MPDRHFFSHGNYRWHIISACKTMNIHMFWGSNILQYKSQSSKEFSLALWWSAVLRIQDCYLIKCKSLKHLLHTLCLMWYRIFPKGWACVVHGSMAMIIGIRHNIEKEEDEWQWVPEKARRTLWIPQQFSIVPSIQIYIVSNCRTVKISK